MHLGVLKKKAGTEVLLLLCWCCLRLVPHKMRYDHKQYFVDIPFIYEKAHKHNIPESFAIQNKGENEFF